MEKKEYQKPIVEFIKIDEEDILTASKMYGSNDDLEEENVIPWVWN